MREWTKVEDKLPEREQYCLVVCKKNGITIAFYNPLSDCWDDDQADDYYCDLICGSITHWMPLPEAPK